MNEKITITLTYNEAVELQQLLHESKDTGDKQFDDVMQSIEKKLCDKLY